MKKLVSILVFFFFTSSLHAENLDRTMAFSISPLAMIPGGLDVMYQVKLTDYVSLTVPANIYYPWWLNMGVKSLANITDGLIKLEQTRVPLWWAAGLGARFLFAGKGLNDSFYLEPRVSFGQAQVGYSLGEKKFEAGFMRITSMGMLGYDLYWDSGFYMSLGFGLGFSYIFNTHIPSALPGDLKKYWLLKFLHKNLSKNKFSPAADLEFKLGYSW